MRLTIDAIQDANGMTSNDVKGLYLNEIPNVKFFPQKLENIFKNLTFIQVTRAGLEEITQEDLKPFTELRRLDLHSNSITVIKNGVFYYSQKITSILLNANKISHIGYNAFDGLNQLIYLDLSSNQCKNSLIRASTRPAVLEVIKQLKSFDCASGDALPSFPNILNDLNEQYQLMRWKINENADLNENHLKIIEDSITKVNTEIETLTLENQNLNQLLNETNRNMENLQEKMRLEMIFGGIVLIGVLLIFYLLTLIARICQRCNEQQRMKEEVHQMNRQNVDAVSNHNYAMNIYNSRQHEINRAGDANEIYSSVAEEIYSNTAGLDSSSF